MKEWTQDSKKIVCGVAAAMAFAALLQFPRISRATDKPQGDAAQGKVLFEKRCTGCHSLDQDKEGPRLRTVYGRKAGTVPSFQYSDAFKNAQFNWNDALLDKWLTNTESVLPNNDMEFRVPSAEERADIIAFLRSSAPSAQH